MRLPFARPVAGLFALVAFAAVAARPASAQQAPVLTRLSSPSITVRTGTSKLLRVQLTVSGRPLPDFQVDWQILSTTAGATGAATTVTDAQGISSARSDFPRAGVTRIRALAPQAGVPLFVDYTVTSVNPPPPPPPETHLVLQPAGATSLALVLGDRAGLAVALRTAAGAPAAGVPVRFAVLSSPGSPGVGRSDHPFRPAPTAWPPPSSASRPWGR